MQPVYFASALIALLAAATVASGQTVAPAQTAAAPDLAPCPGSQPEPARSATWGVAFCNRTAHDIVIQFHENDCPAENWAHRGDVYEKTLRAGETKTIFLCYANEAQPPAPGVPQLRIPGGKGVVTTWSVVGDCGERSNRARLESRSFYDRGDYRTGIVLLQHPSGAAHCAGEAPASAQPEAASVGQTKAAAPAAVASTTGVAGVGSAATRTPTTASASPPASAAAATPRSGSPPSLHATVDTTDRLTRTVNVFATSAPDAPAVNCRFMLTLSFSDGSTWNDRVQAKVSSADSSLVATRKYGKSVTKVELGSVHCQP